MLHVRTPKNAIEIAWEPIAKSSQALALVVPCDEVLYTGSRGPGKTACQLMRFRRRVGIGYGAFWRGIIIDAEYKNLEDLIAQSKRFFRSFDDGARFLESNADYKWVWPTGEELLFRAAKTEADYWKYHGQEFPFIGHNELCRQGTSELYDMMLSCNRSSFTPEKNTPLQAVRYADGTYVCDRDQGKLLPSIPLECFSTTNSYGPGHNWVKKRFITGIAYGEVKRQVHEIFSAQTQKRVKIERKQITIFGSYMENPYLDDKYIAVLHNERNKNRRLAWKTGSWDIVAGGAFDDVWDTSVHVIPRFVIPSNWRVDRGFDWGSTHPFAVIWFTEANGEEIQMTDGTRWTPAAGSIIQIFEWYGTEEIGTNRGIKMNASEIAKTIKSLDKKLREMGWINSAVAPGPADNQIHNVIESATETLATLMAREGVHWERSDKSGHSRKIGLELFRDRLYKATIGEGAGAYIMANCKATLETMPTLPTDPKKIDDVDTHAEDHLWDVWRYRVLKGNNQYATGKSVKVRMAL